jgi:lactoylglutathione lyase
VKRLVVALMALPLLSQPTVVRPRILGVAHLAVYVSDLTRARAFYRDLLGFDEPFTLPKPDGSVDIAFVKINDHQWIELFNRPSAGEGQLNHIAFYISHRGASRCPGRWARAEPGTRTSQ